MIYNIHVEKEQFKETLRGMYGDEIVELKFIPNTSGMHSLYTTYIAAKDKVELIEKDGTIANLTRIFEKWTKS